MWSISKLCFDKAMISFQRWKALHNLLRIVNSNRLISNESSQKGNRQENTHYFGFEAVSPAEKREKVQTVFSTVASKYDLMNDVMSVGIHRFWKDYFIHTLSATPGTKLLDVAGGTGDIAFRFLEATTGDDHASHVPETEDSNNSHVTVLDINEKMLSICKSRAKENGLSNYLTCIQGNAESLPFPDNTFDAYTIAFGIRNVVHIDEALSEALRVLRPGGRFLCLEFSKMRNPSLNRAYNWYSKEIIPVLGELIAGDWKSYQYLVESIQKFPNQDEFAEMIKGTGFRIVTHENLFNGIAAIHSAYKL